MKRYGWLLSGLIPIVLVLALLVFPMAAKAIPVLDFGVVAPTGGSISYAGGVNPLVGVGIDVDNVVGLNTPSNNFVLRNLINGVLNFTTGNFTGSDAAHWYFGKGGNIALTGGVDLDNNSVIDPGEPSGILFIGYFENAVVTYVGGNFKIAGASFVDWKNPLLTEFYGLSNQYAYKGNFNLSFFAAGIPPSGFSSTQVLSGDITNAVPEPASMLLLGSGLVGLAGAARRKFKK